MVLVFAWKLTLVFALAILEFATLLGRQTRYEIGIIIQPYYLLWMLGTGGKNTKMINVIKEMPR